MSTLSPVHFIALQAYSYDISNSGLSSTGETANFPPLSDTSSQTQFHHARVTKSNAWAYSSETLAHQPVDESLDFDQFSSDSVVDRTGQDVFLLQPERSQQVHVGEDMPNTPHSVSGCCSKHYGFSSVLLTENNLYLSVLSVPCTCTR